MQKKPTDNIITEQTKYTTKNHMHNTNERTTEGTKAKMNYGTNEQPEDTRNEAQTRGSKFATPLRRHECAPSGRMGCDKHETYLMSCSAANLPACSAAASS